MDIPEATSPCRSRSSKRDTFDAPVWPMKISNSIDDTVCSPWRQGELPQSFKVPDSGVFSSMTRDHSERSVKSMDSGYSSAAPMSRSSTDDSTPNFMAISSPAAFETKTHAISVEVASQPGPKIPPEEWEKHKQEILNIFRPGSSVNIVRRFMLEKHGFDATYV